jgi:hypothetical protein
VKGGIMLKILWNMVLLGITLAFFAVVIFGALLLVQELLRI